MATLALPDGYHLSFTISQQLWADLLGEALPIQVGQGEFDLVEQGRKLLDVAEDRVRGLLTGVEQRLDEAPVLGSAAGRGVRGGALAVARRGRSLASRRLKNALKVRGKWRARVSRDGSQFAYHEAGVTLDARGVLEVEGRVLLFSEQFEIPFILSRNVDATASLGGVQYNRDRKQLEGNLCGVSLSLGDSLPLRIVKLVADRLIERQIGTMNPLPLIPAKTLEGMVSPSEGPLKLSAGIEDLHVGINETDLTLSVRFAFKGSGVAA